MTARARTASASCGTCPVRPGPGRRPVRSPGGVSTAGEGGVMRYALLIRDDESAMIGPRERSRRLAGFAAFRRGLAERGALVGGGQLQPAEAAATVRCWDGGDIVTTDGP